MRKFYKSALIYGVACAVLAVGIGYGYRHYLSLDPSLDAPAAPVIAIRPYTPVADTKTGLLLAGLTAQNRRDWGEAWQNFSALNDQYLDNPDIALRAFTLAVGNGDFDEAISIATPLADQLFAKDKEGNPLITPPYDLMRLFLILTSIKNDNFDMAQTRLNFLEDSPMVQFSKPILEAWIMAQGTPDDFDLDQKNLKPLQLFYVALALEAIGNQSAATDILTQLADNNLTPNKIPYIAVYFHRNGQSDKAKDLLKTSLIEFPDYKPLNVALSHINNDAAQTLPHHDFTAHLKGAPYALSLAYHDFSNLLLAERAIDSGLLFARMASFLNPDDQSIYMTIGDISTYQKQHREAITAYGKITPDHPDYEHAVTEQINLLEMDEDYEGALAMVQTAIDRTADPDNTYFYYLKGNILKALKQYEDALILYNETEKRALAMNEDGELPRKYWPLYYSRAVVYDLIDQWDKAEADMMTALEKYPDNPIILNYLGYGYADRNINLETALDMLSKAVTGAPSDPYIIDSMGWVLYRTGDYKRAVYYLERAASITPYHMVINDHLGDAYWQVGRKLEAHYMWQRALDYYDDTDEEQRRMIEDTKRKLKDGY